MTIVIPFHDFGGDGPPLHFAHPNGYTPGTFRQFIEPLLPHYRVLGVKHRPLWPGSDPQELTDWHLIAEDMIRFFEQQGLENVVGVGHSLGAVTTMYAAVKRPNLFRTLILIDPVFLPPHILEATIQLGGTVDTPLVLSAIKRRNRWENRQAAFERFRSREVFARWSDEALWDYVNDGLHEDETGEVILTFSREWEARFYSLPPTDVWQVIPQITHPTLAIRGGESDTLFQESWQLWQQLQPQATFVEIPEAGHMVLAERPFLTAQTVLDYLQP